MAATATNKNMLKGLTNVLLTAVFAAVFLFILTLTLSAQTVSINGTVQLGGETNHSGVEIYFEPLSPSARAATVLSESDGFWSNAAVNIGIYNIRIRKNGFVPGIIPNVFLSKDSTFATQSLRAGGVATIAGNISGRTLSGDTLYQVTANLIANEGTLTIGGGAELQFAAGTGLAVSNNAKLMITGTETDRVYFTSGTAVPNFGDWTGVTVNGGTGHRVLHTTFHYANTALRIENFSDVTLDSIRIDRVALRQQNLNVLNGSNFKLLNSYITAKEESNLFLKRVNDFEIHKTEFNQGYPSITLFESKLGLIRNNRFIDYDRYAINCWEPSNQDGAPTVQDANIKIIGNNVLSTKFRNDVVFEINRLGQVEVDSNNVEISGTKKESNTWGFIRARDGIVRNNRIVYLNANSNSSNNHLFLFSSQSKKTDFSENIIEGYSDDGFYPYLGYMYGGVFNRNKFFFKAKWGYGSDDYNSFYANNNSGVQPTGGLEEFIGNTFHVIFESGRFQIRVRGAKVVSNNSFEIISFYTNPNSFYFDNCETVDHNSFRILNQENGGTLHAVTISDNTNFRDNFIEGVRGLRVNRLGVQNEVSNNILLIGSHFQHNTSTITEGILLAGNSSGTVRNNTIYGDTQYSSKGPGFRVIENSEVNLINNVVEGFESAFHFENQLRSFNYNSASNVNSFVAGSFVIPFAGNFSTINHLGSVSDIYYNIRDTHAFSNAYSFNYGSINWSDEAVNITSKFQSIFISNFDYSLSSQSKLIDAGSPDFVDPDGTRSDIGAIPFDRGNPKRLRMLAEANGQLNIAFDPVDRDSVQGYRVFAAVAPNAPVEVDVLDANATEFTLSGLTNNVDYNISMTTVFSNSESIHTPVGKFRPGVGQFAFATSKLLITAPSGAREKSVTYLVQNQGTKTVSVKVEFVATEDGLVGDVNASNLIDLGLFGGSRYYLRTSSVNIFNHRADAASRNLRLAHLTSLEQTNYLMQKISQVGQGGSAYWIGLRNNGVGVWGYWPTTDTTKGFKTASFLPWYSTEYPQNNNSPDYWSTLVTYDTRLVNPHWNSGYRAIYEQAAYVSVNKKSQTITLEPDQTVEIKDVLKFSDGFFTPQLRVTDSEAGALIDSLPFIVISGVGEGLPPVYYPAVTASGESHLVVINSASVDGENLVAGDELALYDGETMVGSTSFNGTFPILMNAYGYSAGNELQLHYYLSGTGESTAATLTVAQGTPTYETGGYSIVTSTGTFRVPLTVSIPNNRFNLVSFNINLPDRAPQNVFANNTQIVQDDEGNVWIPQYSINSIGELRRERSYHIFQNSGETQTVNATGRIINLGEVPVAMFGNRFNNVPALHGSAVPVDQVFAGISSRISIVQDDEGNSWIPELDVNTLGNMVPGRGYQLFLVGRDTTLVYPEIQEEQAAKSVPVASKTAAELQFFTGVISTGLPWNLVIDKLTLPSDMKLTEIGLFDGDILVGSGAVESGRFVITAWKGSTDPDLAGFMSGSPVKVKGWSKESGVVTLVAASVGSSKPVTFGESAYGQVTLTDESLATSISEAVPTKFELSQNYPNPFNPSTMVRFDVPNAGKVTIEVFNLLGQRVATLQNGLVSAGAHRVEWNASKLATGVYIIRMQAPGFSTFRKAMLLK